MIQGIIFDCFGVLYRSSFDEIEQRCPGENLAALRDVRLQRDRGYMDYETYLAAIAELIGSTIDEARAITESAHVRSEPMFGLLDSIDRERYRVGMLSNIGDATIQQLFSEQELSEQFDAVVLSYLEGIIKPDPAIFELMATRLDLLPEECVMIDDIESNCEGARRAGMQAIWHRESEQTASEIKKLIQL